MIALIFLLIIAPCMTGSLISGLTGASLKESLIYRYVSGFMADLAIWTIMTLIYLFVCPHGAFHVLRYAYIAVLTVACLARLIIALLRHENPRNELTLVLSKLKKYFSDASGRFYVTVFFITATAQIFSIMYYAPSEYVQDDYYYNSAVNDAVYMDQLYTKKSKTGIFPQDAETIPPYRISGYKMFLCPWNAFLALIAASSHIHPLIICHTLMPGFIILLIYLVQYIIARYFFRNDIPQIRIFMMWSALLTQAFCYTYYLFHLGIQIATWGKVSAALVGLPVLLITTYETICVSSGKKDFLFLFLIGAGTAMMAASVMMAGSAALFLLMLSCLIKYRKKEVLIYSFASELMILIQLALWLFVIKKG